MRDKKQNTIRPSRHTSRLPRQRFVRDEEGAIAVEWALVAGFLGLLILGAFNYGTAALHKMEMANAVRAGLQYAVVRKPIQGDTSQIVNTVQTAAPTDKTGTRAVTVSMFCRCNDGSSSSCTGNCTSGDPQTFISILMTEDYYSLIKLPFASQKMSFQINGTVQLN
jgi:Flp pilus assembly protein TadG